LRAYLKTIQLDALRGVVSTLDAPRPTTAGSTTVG
jgi:hypothetical protein